MVLDHLISWTDHPTLGIKYFSGTATYCTAFNLTADTLSRDSHLILDLGRVEVMAHVLLNGKDLGILRKAPYRVDVTNAAVIGNNHLNIQVTNLWPNRLIGDEQLPTDCEWKHNSIANWPSWLLNHKPSPTGRIAFTTYQAWNKDSPLQPSGLLGPVKIEFLNQLTLPAPKASKDF